MSDPSTLPQLSSGGAAVITGAASGIGLAAARRFAELGLSVVMADRPGPKLEAAAHELAQDFGEGRVLAAPTDVADPTALDRLRDEALKRYEHVAVLMNNAGVGLNPGGCWTNLADWRRLMEVNLWGAIHGVQAFAPAMVEAGRPAFIINTGSKQGITTPPGNAAYNVSKAALKAYTEALQHELRNSDGCAVSAHLLIPGFTFTGMTARAAEKPPAAWTPAQVVDFMLESLARGDFYILCPDNDVTREMDEKRVLWAAQDIIENRPALSRWHPDYAEAFAAFMKG
ncbi:MAG: SDR family NAD(P)-dependent oxidoreductase [Phenylobacterium sp.]|uniref:SDR family NAD(P)-dependent oxidoreductase n=1 Tax=Phenylobacterium sp. TaxID=1871053 RepID=UPI00391CB274